MDEQSFSPTPCVEDCILQKRLHNNTAPVLLSAEVLLPGMLCYQQHFPVHAYFQKYFAVPNCFRCPASLLHLERFAHCAAAKYSSRHQVSLIPLRTGHVYQVLITLPHSQDYFHVDGSKLPPWMSVYRLWWD